MLNTYNLAYVGFEISTLKLTRIHLKTLYMSKSKVGCPLAQTTTGTGTMTCFSCLVLRLGLWFTKSLSSTQC